MQPLAQKFSELLIAGSYVALPKEWSFEFACFLLSFA